MNEAGDLDKLQEELFIDDYSFGDDESESEERMAWAQYNDVDEFDDAEGEDSEFERWREQDRKDSEEEREKDDDEHEIEEQKIWQLLADNFRFQSVFYMFLPHDTLPLNLLLEDHDGSEEYQLD